MHMGLSGKVVWVTGATGAIGREIALAFAREGARIAASARTPEKLEALVAELHRTGGDAQGFPVDVTDPSTVWQCAQDIVARMGALDVLVASVAVPAFGPFLEIGVERFRTALEVKYLGYIACCQAALPVMQKQGSGVIIAITGTGGKKPIGIHLPGGGANAALNLVLKGLANEFGPQGIRVNMVSPGPIISERQQQMIDAGMNNPAEGVPLGRLGEASEVADAVVFLSSARAAYITGQLLHVDGGGVEAL